MTYCPKAIRKDFPIYAHYKSKGEPFIYLDTAAMAQKPLAMIDATVRFYSEECSTVHRSVYSQAVQSSEQYASVRTKVAAFVHAEREEEIIFTRGTTEAINLVAMCYGRKNLKAGDEILLTEMEHHSNLIPWKRLAEEIGAKVLYVAILEDGSLDLEDYRKKLSKQTKIVAFTHISNVLGTINPAKKMIAMAHEVGAITVLDGAQSAPHIPIDVRSLDVDFFAFSGSKMYGPTGIGMLYGKYDLLYAMPPYHGGGDMVDQVTLEHTSYQDPPLKFEAGTPMIAGVLGLGATIDYLQAFSHTERMLHEKNLLTYATDRLENEVSGLQIYGKAPEKAPIISFTIKGVHPLDLATMLGLKGIMIRTGHLCAQPTLQRFQLSSLARVSLGLYNTKEDVDVLISAIKEILPLLQRDAIVF